MRSDSLVPIAFLSTTVANWDTVRKARRWLDDQGIAYAFHDFKKEGADPMRLAGWSDGAGWEVLLNKRGTTFRALPEEDKRDLDQARAIALMAAQPSLIKRPVMEYDGGILVGFDENIWRGKLT